MFIFLYQTTRRQTLHNHKFKLGVQYNTAYPKAGYSDLLGTSGQFVKNSTNLTCLEITGCRIKYSTVQYSTAQHNTAQHSTAQYSTVYCYGL
jgi:hypothetical protein